MKCGYNMATQRCIKLNRVSDKNKDKDKDKRPQDIPSEFCNYNKKTGFCVLKDKPPRLKKKDLIVYDNLVLENICEIKCKVHGLGDTTLTYLEEVYPIPKDYYLKYGVLTSGAGVVYNPDGYIHEIYLNNNIMVINQGEFTISIYPNNK